MNFLKLLFFLVLVNLSTANFLYSEIKTPTKTIEDAIDEIIIIVANNQGQEKTTERRDGIMKVVEKVFDFQDMAKRALGSNWANITNDQQTEYVDLFSKFLAKTYIDKVEDVKPGIVTFDSERTIEDKALVKTKVSLNKELFPLDYKLQSHPDSWRVYDVVIENVGLVTNYRNEFAGIMRKEKFEGLMERLRKKVNS
jgi:phospholipid transport system substrate-binding protein